MSAIAVGVAGAAAVVATGCASLDRWQREAIFQTEVAARVYGRAAPDSAEQFDLPLPGGGETGADTVRFWYLASPDPGASTVLFLHGARRNLYDNAARIERLNALGFNVLAMDYRGFGRSTRILPTEESALEDARLGFAELQRRQPVGRKRLLYGYSLGGAVAIALAEQVDGVAAVVVEATFTSIADVVRQRRWIPFIGLAVTQKFDSLARITQVNEPLLFLHGTADRVVPHAMSDQLHDAARRVPAELKRVVKIEGASHWGVMSLDPDSFGRSVRDFLAVATGTARASSGATSATTSSAASASLPR